MSTLTPNYELIVPDNSDTVEQVRADYETNLRIIDDNLGGGGGSGGHTIVNPSGTDMPAEGKLQFTGGVTVTDDSVNGKTVVDISGGGDSVTWTQIQQSGTKIAEIEINGVTTDVYAPQGAPPFTALIIITADTGSTITATKGADTYTATEVTTGQYEVTVDSIGTWTISDGTLSDTVTVTAQTTYYVTLSAVPDGRTVLPTDDIQIWLNCADIWDKTYTTLAEVLADTTTLLALINSSNAVDYMVRSTTWASGLTTNSTAMSYIGLNNYCANTLLADSTWCNAICNSEYFESVLNVKVPVMTSATTPSGEVIDSGSVNSNYVGYKAFNGVVSTFFGNRWVSIQYSSSAQVSGQYLGYIFPDSVLVSMLTIQQQTIESYTYDTMIDTTVAVQYSDDNISWTTVKNISLTSATAKQAVKHIVNNVTSHRYHRLLFNNANMRDTQINKYCAVITELQFYGREDV